MSEVSPAYVLASNVHQRLFGDLDNQQRGGLAPGEVRADISEQSGTERLTAIGLIDGMRAYQHLSRSPKTGDFYFSTVFTDPGGKVINVRISPNSPVDRMVPLIRSLFCAGDLAST